MVPTNIESAGANGSAGVGLVLDVLSAQLGDTARHVEASVSQVCTSFASIARRTKENSAHAARSAGHGNGDAQTSARATIAGLLGRMDTVQRAADESVATLRRIEAIATRVDSIQSALEEVDVVAHALRILALNARIEAARAGQHGRGFGVVASETGELATTIRATAKSVRKMVDGLWQEVKDSTKRMRAGLGQTQAAGDIGQVADQSREEGKRALEAMARAQTEMQELVTEAAVNSAQLAEDIEDAMTALQFQDAVNQQIEHVVSALTEAREALESGDDTLADELVQRLRARATMQSERKLLARMTAGRASARDDADEPVDSAPGSVELF